jgi:hypothetical protein
MDWNSLDTARAFLQAGSPEPAIHLLRELRRSFLHPAVGPLLAQAMRAAGDPDAGERVLAEDCFVGIADHWTWLTRADLIEQGARADIASLHRAKAYELLGWPHCASKGYRFDGDEVSQLLPLWSRVFGLLLPRGPLQVLSVHGGSGGFALWALERLAHRGGLLATSGSFDDSFTENLLRTGAEELHQPMDALLEAEAVPHWDVIHLGPRCVPMDGCQELLRSMLMPEGVMLAHDETCLNGEETIYPGVQLAGLMALAEEVDQGWSS